MLMPFLISASELNGFAGHHPDITRATSWPVDTPGVKTDVQTVMRMCVQSLTT